MNLLNKKKSGFSLVEIMIIVLIIGILAALAVPNLLRARIEANEATAKATLKLISNALENYGSINHIYPTTTSSLMGAAPPYLSIDYFSSPVNGYSFTASLTDYTYSITAVPLNSSQGNSSYSINTSGLLLKN